MQTSSNVRQVIIHYSAVAALKNVIIQLKPVQCCFSSIEQMNF